MLRPDPKVLRGALPLLALIALPACSSSGSTAAGDGGPAPFDAGPRIADDMAQSERQACTFNRGAMPAQTVGASTPIGPDIPIDNVVVVMMENHSFDSYLGHLNEFGQRTGAGSVESAPADASNPLDAGADGGSAPWAHAPHLCSVDTDHGWAGTHIEIDDGKMDGFAQRNDGTPVPAAPGGGTLDPSLGSGARAMWWYDQTDLPFYYKLADTFAIADHYHCSVPGPTWPNRRFLYAATSWGGTVTNLPLVLENEADYPYPAKPATVLDELEASKTTWMYYSDGLSTLLLLYSHPTTRWGRNPITNMAAFQTAAREGKLPHVSFVDPALSLTGGNGAEQDEHPPGDIQVGQQFVAQVVQAVMAGPQWAHTAVLITHDEHGGFYDHVAPPKACAPDSIAPILTTGDTGTDGGFDMDGVRVVLIAVSPYSKKGYVGHHVYDHTSITRFIETRFNLPALTARDANAEPITDLFDFVNPPAFLTPPPLTTPPIDPAGFDYCTQTFGDGGM
jgi:phospholipase C